MTSLILGSTSSKIEKTKGKINYTLKMDVQRNADCVAKSGIPAETNT